MVTWDVPKRVGECLHGDASLLAQQLADAPPALLDQEPAFARGRHQSGYRLEHQEAFEGDVQRCG